MNYGRNLRGPVISERGSAAKRLPRSVGSRKEELSWVVDGGAGRRGKERFARVLANRPFPFATRRDTGLPKAGGLGFHVQAATRADCPFPVHRGRGSGFTLIGDAAQLAAPPQAGFLSRGDSPRRGLGKPAPSRPVAASAIPPFPHCAIKDQLSTLKGRGGSI